MLLLLGQTLALLLQPRRVIALVGDALSAVQLQNPSRHVVQEVAVVRHAQHRAFVLLQVLFQPIDGFRVKVVRRLVQEQHVRLLQQQTAQGHPTSLSSAEFRNLLVVRRTAQGVHGDAQLGVELPSIQRIDLVLNRRLAVHELLHFVGVVQDLFVHERHVDLLVFLQDVHNLLGALFDHLAHRFGLVQFRFLRQVANRVTV